MPMDNAPTTSINDLNRDIDSFGADVLTAAMPPNLFTHGERIDAGQPSSNTADPSQPTRAFADGLFSHGTDLLFGETGKQLPLFVDQVNTLCLMRAGYTTGDVLVVDGGFTLT